MPIVDLAQFRRDTAANWTSVNPVLAAGEPGYETDTRRLKFGTSTTAWTSLPYFADALAARQLTKRTITAADSVVLADATDVVLYLDSANPFTLTVPSNATAAIPQNVPIPWVQSGAGQVTVAAGGGATVESRGGALKTAGQWASGSLMKVTANKWLWSGDVTT